MNLEPVSRPPSIDKIYFDGAAWGMMYYTHMYEVIREFQKPRDTLPGPAPRHIVAHPAYYGTSSGALCIVMAACGFSSDELVEWYNRYSDMAIDKMVRMEDSVSYTQYHLQVLKEIIERTSDAYERVMRFKAHIGITTELAGFQWVSRFESNEDLINVLLCSFHIPGLCTYDARYNGESAVDGGIGFDVRQFFPETPETTLTITSGNNATFDVIAEMFHVSCFIVSPRLVRNYWIMEGRGMLRSYLRGDADISKPDIADNSSFLSMAQEFWWVIRRFQPITHTYNDIKSASK
jgi:hypothetical protein